MRTPVVLVAGQAGAGDIADRLARAPGTLSVSHRFDGQVVLRTVSTPRGGNEAALEVANGCVACTVRDDLLVLLRRLHRRGDVGRIVVQLLPWLEPEPVCWAIENVAVRVGPGYVDGPAARDVCIDAVVTCVDAANWLPNALGDDELDDGRTVAQVVVGQAEFADVLVLTEPDAAALAVLRRLAPSARITVGPARVDMALAHLEPATRRGRSRHPHDPLLVGQPPLHADGEVALLEFSARRPFHPPRLHAALDLLLDGVVRTRGRLWLASRPDDVMWLESAGGGLIFTYAGKWLAAMDSNRLAYVDPERRALAALHWHDRFGDRHVSMTILVCGAAREEVVEALRGALLTDAEMTRPHAWADYPDPFGDWHEDPCDERAQPVGDAAAPGDHEGDQP